MSVLRRLAGWEGLLLAMLVAVLAFNILRSPYYLGVSNIVNLFQLEIEKIIVALVMTLIIINGEIDLSVASVMGLSACVLAWTFQMGIPVPYGIVIALLVGGVCGLINGFWVAYVGLPSLAVTLAGLIGYRGVARILLEDRAIGGYPDWFNALGQQPLIGPLTLSIIVFVVLFAIVYVLLQRSGLGRLVYVMGNSLQAARYSGVRVRRVKMALFVMSSVIAALAGLLYAARLGSVRGDMAQGFELDIITIVLLGGVSIFGGSGNLVGVGLSILVVLNLRNGMGLADITGNTQTSVIGALLILSVLLPNIAQAIHKKWRGPKSMKKQLIASVALAALALLPLRAMAQATVPTGKAESMVLLPKFLGILPFDQAHKGAEEAAKELGNATPLQFLGPTPENSVAGQIEIVTNATTQGVSAIMISNNSGDQIVPAAKAAHAKGIKVVTWDSPIPSAEGEDVFVAQVDFSETGKVMADMALDILGPNGGKFAILSASPDAANQNAWIAALQTALKDPKYAKLQQVGIVYGNDQSERSYNQALALVDKYPDIKLIMAPTSVGIVAAAKAMQDENLCGKIKVSGLGVPSEMLAYTKNGCAPEFALWSFVDLGYLAYYTAYGLATGAIKAEAGQSFKAGRLGNYTITKDPTRKEGLRILMGPFSIYNKDNVEAAAK
jgi:rhamnose ABC transporter rhamnose-binding protein